MGRRQVLVLCAIALASAGTWLAVRSHGGPQPVTPPASIDPRSAPKTPNLTHPERVLRPELPGTLPRSDVYERIAKLREGLARRAARSEIRKTESSDLFFQARRALDRAEARRLMERALQEDPDSVEALSALAELALGDGKLETARHGAIACLALDEKNAACHRTLIATYTRFGKFDEAYPYLSDCVEVDPENLHCLGGLVNYYLSKKDGEKAASFVEWMRAVDAGSMWTALADAGVQLASGKRDLALASFRRVCEAGQLYACSRVRELTQ